MHRRRENSGRVKRVEEEKKGEMMALFGEETYGKLESFDKTNSLLH
jgi:hypothetical protein